MNKKITQLEITAALTPFLNNGGVILKCKPKLAPKRRIKKLKSNHSKQKSISYFKLLIGGARE